MAPAATVGDFKERRIVVTTTMVRKNEQAEELRRINALVTPAFFKRLEDWRRHQADLPTVSEAVRRLIEIGMSNSQKPGKKGRNE